MNSLLGKYYPSMSQRYQSGGLLGLFGYGQQAPQAPQENTGPLIGGYGTEGMYPVNYQAMDLLGYSQKPQMQEEHRGGLLGSFAPRMTDNYNAGGLLGLLRGFK